MLDMVRQGDWELSGIAAESIIEWSLMLGLRLAEHQMRLRVLRTSRRTEPARPAVASQVTHDPDGYRLRARDGRSSCMYHPPPRRMST